MTPSSADARCWRLRFVSVRLRAYALFDAELARTKAVDVTRTHTANNACRHGIFLYLPPRHSWLLSLLSPLRHLTTFCRPVAEQMLLTVYARHLQTDVAGG